MSSGLHEGIDMFIVFSDVDITETGIGSASDFLGPSLYEDQEIDSRLRPTFGLHSSSLNEVAQIFLLLPSRTKIVSGSPLLHRPTTPLDKLCLLVCVSLLKSIMLLNHQTLLTPYAKK